MKIENYQTKNGLSLLLFICEKLHCSHALRMRWLLSEQLTLKHSPVMSISFFAISLLFLMSFLQFRVTLFLV